MKREERDLCRLPTSFLSRMHSRFLNNQWRFCHVRHNPENRFEFESEQERERLLNLSARSNFKWTNQSSGWNDLGSDRCCGPHLKPLRKAEEASFKANFSFFKSLSTAEAHVFGVKLISFYFVLRRKRFVEWRLASDGWSGFPANRGLLQRGQS